MPAPDGVPASPVKDGELLLGRYRVVDQLAEGGHSVIFRAEDERLRRPACVKLLRLPNIDPAFRTAIEERFVKEAFLLGRLCHPTTIKIFDFGYFRTRSRGDKADKADKRSGTGEIPFQVSELISGGPLSRWVKRRGRLGAAELLALMTPIARALSEVHSAGIAHLDVKPQNILLARTALGREPKLADFGISETIEPRVATGPRQVLLYSVNWAAPEQMIGESIGAYSDVYALALVVIYALTGKLVFCEQDPIKAYRLRKSSSDALVDAVAGAALPDELLELLARAIHFEPALRFGDVMEFLQLVERALAPLLRAAAPVPLPSISDDSGPSPTEGLTIDRSVPDRVTAANLWHVQAGSLARGGQGEGTGDRETLNVAGRVIRFVKVADSVDVEADKIRLRVAFVPVAGDKIGLHVKGLNCFVSLAGRRPSSAVTFDGNATLEFISAGGEQLGRAEASFAAAGLTRTVVSVDRQSLAVPSEDCRNLVALDFGPGLTCPLLCEPR
jgi:serine/threonine protein kinase